MAIPGSGVLASRSHLVVQGTRLEAETFRAAQHLGDVDQCRPELMTNLLGLDSYPVKSQEHDQRGKTRISLFLFGHVRTPFLQKGAAPCGDCSICLIKYSFQTV